MSMEESIEDTHYVCAKHLRELGGKAPCCECSGGKDCSFIGTEDDLKEEKDTSLEDRFDEQFMIGKGRKWIMTVDEADEVKQFIRQEREALLKEIVEKCEGLKPTEFEEGYTTQDAIAFREGKRHALNQVQELIKKKI